MDIIARQSNGLLCRFSTETNTIVNYNMTDKDYIDSCVNRAKEKAQNALDEEKSMDDIINMFSPTDMPQKDFDKIIEKTKVLTVLNTSPSEEKDNTIVFKAKRFKSSPNNNLSVAESIQLDLICSILIAILEELEIIKFKDIIEELMEVYDITASELMGRD